MILGLTACDNVRWGGADFAVVSPPPRATVTPVVDDDEEQVARMPTGPVLFRVQLGEAGPIVTPLAEIDGDTLVPIRAGADVETFGTRFIAEHMRQGTELVLFSNAVRVGTFVVESALLPDGQACPFTPRATGTLEVAAGVELATEMLALSRLHAPQVLRRLDVPAEPTGRMRVVGPILAERIMRARRSPLPASWPRAMQQLRPFPYGASEVAFAATFLVGDELGPGGNNEGHSTFFIGVPVQASFDTTFVEHTVYQQAGKRAPRVVDFLDWNRSGQVELLLEVYTVNDSWFEALGRAPNGRWRRIFDGRCPGAAQPAQPAEPADPAAASSPP
jgi:hypothetical protein